MKYRKGRLIVIDGGDGSGKTTQAKMLVKFLKENKYPVKYFDFPQYDSFYGKTIAKFLQGEFGDINQVSPYLASLAYALDRASAKNEMEFLLKKGAYIVANRYATSNIAHQGAKFFDIKERGRYVKWEYELEYKIHRIPKEDIVVYLYVPWKIGIKLTENRKKRKYLQGHIKDIHEKDLEHRTEVEKMYLSLAERHNHWVKVDCVVNGKLLSPQKIHNKIVDVLTRRSVIPAFTPSGVEEKVGL